MAKEVKKEKINPIKKTIKKVVKRGKKDVKPKLFEEKGDLTKLYLYIIVVDIEVARTVEKLMQTLGSSIQITHTGRGTATKEILNVLGVTQDTKGIVNAIVSEDRIKEVNQELEIFFKASKRNRGVAFSIPFSSVQGVKIYKYLTQTI